SGMGDDAGLQPAFMDYRRIGARYGRLIEQFRTGRHVHAYLLTGPQGIGKRTLARYLASVLFCENDAKPCGKCSQCRMIQEGKHSSVLEISPEERKTVIPVDRIREVVTLSSMHSLDGRARVILIEPMENLLPQAQNSLLKSLEEPDTNVIYFLLSHDVSPLLDTILSRCSLFKLTPWPSELLEQHLLKRGYPRGAVERAAALAGGNVGEALSILSEQPGGSNNSALRQMLSVSNVRDAVLCGAMFKDMAGNADQILFLLERYLQQCMMVKSGLLPAELLQDTPWQHCIRDAEMPDLIALTDQVFRARKLKMSNVNWQSNIDQLTLRLLEATSKWQKS
ncbi:MAG: DNA polymerase III subunit, partial [Bacillota bacterium]